VNKDLYKNAVKVFTVSPIMNPAETCSSEGWIHYAFNVRCIEWM